MIRLRGATARLATVLMMVLAIGVTSTIMYPAQVAKADACSINGRDCYFGYFYNGYDGGPGVRQHNVFSAPALLNVNNPEDLINTIRSHMVCGGGRLLNAGEQNATGSAFIINTMLGLPAGTSKDAACQQFDKWAGIVRDWAPNTNYNLNYYFAGLNTRSTYTDVAWYISAQTTAYSIVFFDKVDGHPLYAIKKDCGNPVGRLESLDQPYTLTPHVDTISPTNIEAGSKVSVNTSVDNVGDRPSANTQWEITQITVKPGKKAPHEDENGTVSGTAPCQSNGGAPAGDYFVSGDADCKNVAKGNGIFNLGTPAQNLKPSVSGLDVGDLPVGTRVCFALSVQPRSNNDGAWAHSKPICTTVGKKPKVQIWGGDLGVRGMVDTSTSVKDMGGNKTFGSWVEYGVFAVGTVNRFASGSGLVNQASNNQVDWSKLTFANKNLAGADAFGNYSTLAGFRPVPTVASFFGNIQDKTAVSGSLNVGDPSKQFTTGDSVKVNTAGDLSVSGTIGLKKSVVIIASGTVTIDNNIQYDDGTLGSIHDIPQVVIIANNINITDNVSRVDAWLVTTGTIDTCSNVTTTLTSNKCNQPLEVNGPVITNKLVLKRTAGSDTGAASGDPAERFNLRPDAYLWAQLQASGNNKAQTVYSRELPPRF